MPLGSAHIPAHRNGKARAASSAALQAKPFLDEAARWTPEEVRRSCDDTASLGGAERESFSPATSPIPRPHSPPRLFLPAPPPPPRHHPPTSLQHRSPPPPLAA